MSTNAAVLQILVLALLIGGLPLLYPRIARRGLLFGVYVGEERWAGEEARRITRAWQTGMALWTLGSAGLGSALFLWHPTPIVLALVTMGVILAITTGTVILYIRAYYRAHSLAAPGRIPPAAAILSDSQSSSRLPLVVLTAGVLCGIFALGYAALHYPDLPARVPTHFGLRGRPDAWRPKSFWTVMLLPMMTLVMGAGMGVLALFISRAKRAIRFPQAQISAEAQMRFRRAFTRFMCLIAVLVTALLTSISVGAIRVGLGHAEGLSPFIMLTTVGLGAVAVGGTLYLLFRYGQGGSRLESGAGDAPLTNGLADNRYWRLGVFYVNRDDPSVFVERRFGFGYTINFGNWKAVAFFGVFIILVLALAVAGVVKG